VIKSVSPPRHDTRGAGALDPRPAARLTLDMGKADDPHSPAGIGRRLLRRCERAALGTSFEGAPFVSLVLCAVDLDASPLLLISDLAQHSRNIACDPRVSLLFDGTGTHPEPLAGPRLTVLGRAKAASEPRLLARFAARHPSSAAYSGFADFKLCRVVVERAQLVAGFGRIAWLAAGDLLLDGNHTEIAAAESAILAHINNRLRKTLARGIARQLGRGGAGWQATGLDPEGLDVRRGATAARLCFATPVATAEAVPAALAELAAAAVE
jgi:heme iron utilization protein